MMLKTRTVVVYLKEKFKSFSMRTANLWLKLPRRDYIDEGTKNVSFQSEMSKLKQKMLWSQYGVSWVDNRSKNILWNKYLWLDIAIALLPCTLIKTLFTIIMHFSSVSIFLEWPSGRFTYTPAGGSPCWSKVSWRFALLLRIQFKLLIIILSMGLIVISTSIFFVSSFLFLITWGSRYVGVSREWLLTQ